MKKTIDVAARTVTFTFDGGLAPVTLGLDQVSADVQLHAALHGLSQKIGDNAAISKSEENNWTVTEAMRQTAVDAMIGQLIAGDWNTKSRATPKQDKSILAIAAKRGCTYDEALVWFNERMMSELA